MRKFNVDETTRPDQITDALISKGLIRANGGVGCPEPAVAATNQPLLETSRAPTRETATQLIDETRNRLAQDSATANTANAEPKVIRALNLATVAAPEDVLGSTSRARSDSPSSAETAPRRVANAQPTVAQQAAVHRPGDASITRGRDTVASGAQRRYRAYRRRRTKLARSAHRAGARHRGSRAVGRR
jgi:hypothetical protein